MDTRLHSLKNASKKGVHKEGKFLGNKNADEVTKWTDGKIVKSDENLGNVEEIVIPPEKRDEKLMELRKALWKPNPMKYLSY